MLQKNPSVGLTLTNSTSFQCSCVIETGLADFHKMTVTVIKTAFQKLKPKITYYRYFKMYSNDKFREEPLSKLSMENISNKANSFFDCLNPNRVKLITRLRLRLSHLRDHKEKHSFQDCLNPLCSCGIEVETTAHFQLHCLNYLHEIKTLLGNIKSVLVWRKVTHLLIMFFSLVIPL